MSIRSFRSALFLLAAPAVFLTCTTSRKAASTSVQKDADPRWVVIDSLNAIGQYATALEHTDIILADARAQDDWRTEFRAWMSKGRLQALTGIDRKEILTAVEERAATSGTPLRQLLHSALGAAYWSYYQNERWQILDRSETTGDNTDPETWTQGRFMAKVIAEYRASLEPFDSLKHIPVGDLGELLTDDARAKALRPTLYDLLAHRALDVFTHPETRLTEPDWRFKLDDARSFELFEPFIFQRLTHRDSTAWEFQAMRLYQRLERLHINNDTIDALVDVTLKRLSFVRAHSTHVRKDSLYLEALELLRTRLPNDSCWSEVTVAIAHWHAEQGEKYDRLSGDAWKWEKRTAQALCDSAIARWPRSFGARNAIALKARLEQPSFNVQCEEAIAPEVSFPIALHYTNLKRIWLRVVKTPVEINAKPKDDHGKWITSQPAMREWSVELPDDGDLNEHLVELPVENLPFGGYAILASSTQSFTPQQDLVGYCNFRVTNLALVQRNNGSRVDALVLDRTSGAPRGGVKATVYARSNDYSDGRKFLPVADRVSDEQGAISIDIQSRRGEVVWELEADGDRYMSGTNWVYDHGAPGSPDSLRTFLFTDRAIYRPGQEVMFKGIITAKRGKWNATKADLKTTVRFFDVNGELVDSVNVTTNDFGSFSGRFTAPEGALTGGMRLEEAHGSQYFQVEEYKRPTFELDFDPVTATPKLEQEATVTGIAKSYAGAPLDGAKVKWTVTRGARMPWWCGWGWRGLPWGRETEIASGEATCDSQGKFTVKFVAQADKIFPRGSDPTFYYTVEAAATDINGETQQASTSLNIGYRSIDIAINAGDAIDRSRTDSLGIELRNLNGQEVDLPMEVRIISLMSPADAPQRARLWEQPDRNVDGSAMANTDEVLRWPEGSAYLLRSEHRAKGGALRLTGINEWPVGMYRIDVKARDADGVLVEASRAITLFDTAIQNTGFINEAFHVEPITVRCEPGEKAVLLLSSALPDGRILMEVERAGAIVVNRRFVLSRGQQRIELPVLESDRGGFAVHFLCVERGRVHNLTQWIDVPWTNKDLQVEWMSFRDKLLPGQKEEWRLRITGPKKEKVAAQLLGVLYDASLDHFIPHNWDTDVWQQNGVQRPWSRMEPFGLSYAQRIYNAENLPTDSVRAYPLLKDGDGLASGYYYRGRHQYRSMDGDMLFEVQAGNVAVDRAEMTATPSSGLVDEESGGEGEKEAKEPQAPSSDPTSAAPPQPVLRSDFRETAFFFPDLLTDRDGSVVLRFTMPDALTRWKFLGLAHTKDLQLANLSKETITQKPMMIVPNLPRFLRQGDRITLTSKINVIEGATVNGTASLELYDPYTNKPMTSSFGLVKAERSFSAAPGQSANVIWELSVPEGLDAVGVRTVANGVGMSDGEERMLPILTDRVLVTESLPLSITKAGTKSFTLDKLKNNSSTTLRHQSLKLEFTPNPAWYAVQALPYLMEFPHECAEQVFSRYYANRLAAHIVEERPVIKQVFEQWSKPGNETAFLSALEKNPELKGIVLTEAPWVLNATDEGERKRRVALFFDLQRMANEEATALKKLADMQLPNGAWPWWSGMAPSRYITQHIVAGLGHLQQLDALDKNPDSQTRQMLRRAVEWLDQQVEEDHKRMLRDFRGDTIPMPSPEDFHFLYARSFFPQWPLERRKDGAVEFIMERGRTYWAHFRMQEQPMLALALHRLGEGPTAALIMESLKQRATVSEELGMYWKGIDAGTYWYEFPTETHALMIEAFDEVTKDKAPVNLLRQYLLKLKQTTDWKTTKATADACYALLLTGDDWLDPKAPPVIKVGTEQVSADRQEAGTGYFEKTWTGAQVKPAMGEVTISTTSDGVQWGALHWQYFEQMDKVTPHESPFSIRKQVMLHEQTDAGARLVALDGAHALKPGDKLTIRIELRTDRYVDYVHMKDHRASGLEPVDALSGYQWQGGLGYYRSIRDASMNFFFDRIAPGTYVFEYDLRVTHAGDFSNGITTAMCMYAPEFSSHSAGGRVLVGEP